MAAYSSHTDQELLALLKEGSQAAFAEIYNRYKSPMLLHAYRMIQDGEEAKDLVQEMFAVVWAKHSELKVTSTLDGYLYTALKNRILNYAAHQKVIAKYTDSLERYFEQGTPASDDKMIEAELIAMIEAEIANLPKKMRQIFELHRNEGLTYKQIAEKLNVSDHTVRSQLHNATKILKTKINLTVLFQLFV